MVFIVLGVVFNLETAYSLLDFLLGLVVITNMIGVLLMGGQAVEMKNQYFKDPKYYPKANK